MEIHYQNKYIAFLDVLGFKELVFSADSIKVEDYFNSIEDTLDDIRRDKETINSFVISDSIMLIAPDTVGDLKRLLTAIQKIQSKLASKNIWLRGAVSFGEIFFDTSRNLVVGKGMIKAYLLGNEAIHPRVILDPSIILKIAENREAFFQIINANFYQKQTRGLKLIHEEYYNVKDDAFFVDYASRVIIDSIDDNKESEITGLLKKNLYSDQKHYEKYNWLKHYFASAAYNMESYEQRSYYTWIVEENRKKIKKMWEVIVSL